MMTELAEELREHALSDDGCSPFNADGKLVNRAADHIETLEAAFRTIQSAIPGYLKGEMSEHDFALLVLGEVDNGKVNKALEKCR